MLYWVMAIVEPTKKEREEEAKMEKIVLQPKIIVAKDDKDAAIKVVMNEDLKEHDQNRLQVVVRPF